jgi:pyruvate carboxylase subunit A
MKAIMQDPDFREGRFDTSYIEAHPQLLDYEETIEPEDLVLAIAAAIAAHEGL